MGRTPTTDGKRNGWSVKLSDAKSGRADELRGQVPRALWLESLIDGAIAAAGGTVKTGGGRDDTRSRSRSVSALSAAQDGEVPGTGTAGERTARDAGPRSAGAAPSRGARSPARRRSAPEVPAGTVRFMEPGGDPVVSHPAPEVPGPEQARKRGACKHPNMRMAKGVCPDCQEWVTG